MNSSNHFPSSPSIGYLPCVEAPSTDFLSASGDSPRPQTGSPSALGLGPASSRPQLPPRPCTASDQLPLGLRPTPPSSSYGLGPASPQPQTSSPLILVRPQTSFPSASYRLSLGTRPRTSFPSASDQLPSASNYSPRHSASDWLSLGLGSRASAASMGQHTPTCSFHMHGSGAILLLFHVATSQQHNPPFSLSLLCPRSHTNSTLRACSASGPLPSASAMNSAMQVNSAM